MTEIKWVLWCLVVLEIIIILFGTIMWLKFDYLTNTLANFDYYGMREGIFDNAKKNTSLLGIYYDDMYYCVWTKGRNDIDINNTEKHEYCHYLIAQVDEKHFCK